jgi:hypothetical protein
MAKMTTWIARFEIGDYPMICARSGLPADKLIPVEAARSAAWPWIFGRFSLPFWIARWGVGKSRLWGKLPFASGHVDGISATWDRREGVVTLRGVHARFVAACREQQSASNPPDDR